MPDLYLHGRPVRTIFRLIGGNEDDITASLGWAFANVEPFARRLVERWHPRTRPVGNVRSIRLQEHVAGEGITDVEVWTERTGTVIEAKRGWVLPTHEQLAQYEPRLIGQPAAPALVVLSECSNDWARRRLPAEVGRIPVLPCRWSDLLAVAEEVGPDCTQRQRRTLAELAAYLCEVTTVQEQDTSRVYVVSLKPGTMGRSDLTWIAVIADHRLYFHPYDYPGWPKEPPTYIGFRYYGRLQSIHHVDDYEVTQDLPESLRKLTGASVDREVLTNHPHFLYRLGPPIRPEGEVKTGRLYGAARVWAALDLLLTCDTVAQACAMAKERFGS